MTIIAGTTVSVLGTQIAQSSFFENYIPLFLQTVGGMLAFGTMVFCTI
jgi:hypothetical protein